MLAITLADLRFRLRQFLIAVVGAGVVFAMALLLTGMVKGFYNEVTRTVASAQADVWVLPEGTSGPFTSVRSFPEATVARLAKVPGVEQVSGLAISPKTLNRAGSGLLRAMVIGAPIGSPAQVWSPPTTTGSRTWQTLWSSCPRTATRSTASPRTSRWPKARRCSGRAIPATSCTS